MSWSGWFEFVRPFDKVMAGCILTVKILDVGWAVDPFGISYLAQSCAKYIM
jgi:hypothetical protein